MTNNTNVSVFYTIVDVFDDNGVSIMPETNRAWLFLPEQHDIKSLLIEDEKGWRRLVELRGGYAAEVYQWVYWFWLYDRDHFLTISMQPGNRFVATQVGTDDHTDGAVYLYREPIIPAQ